MNKIKSVVFLGFLCSQMGVSSEQFSIVESYEGVNKAKQTELKGNSVNEIGVAQAKIKEGEMLNQPAAEQHIALGENSVQEDDYESSSLSTSHEEEEIPELSQQEIEEELVGGLEAIKQMSEVFGIEFNSMINAMARLLPAGDSYAFRAYASEKISKSPK